MYYAYGGNVIFYQLLLNSHSNGTETGQSINKTIIDDIGIGYLLF